MTRSPTIFTYTNPSGVVVWKADVQVGVKPNGKPRFTRLTASTKKEATRLASDAQIRAHHGALAPEGKERLGSFAPRWLSDTKAPEVRLATAEDYRYKLEHYILPTFGDRPLVAISTADVTAWLKQLHDSGKSNYTISGVKQVLGAVMKAAVTYGFISRNPVANAPAYRKSRRTTVNVREPWTRDEAQQVLTAIRGESIELFATLLIYLALRKSEALGLKWADLDFTTSTVTIKRSIREITVTQADGTRKTTTVEGDPKTNSSRRTLVLTQPVLEVLMRHRNRIENPRRLEPDAWVFSSPSGNVQRPGNLARSFNRLLEKNQLRRIRIHDIRHTALLLAIETGIPIEAVSQGAGHSRLDTTKSIYAPYSQTLADTFSQDLSRSLSGDRIDSRLRELLAGETVKIPPPGT